MKTLYVKICFVRVARFLILIIRLLVMFKLCSWRIIEVVHRNLLIFFSSKINTQYLNTGSLL